MRPSLLDSFDSAFAPPRKVETRPGLKRRAGILGRTLFGWMMPGRRHREAGELSPRPHADKACDASGGRLWRVGEWPADDPSPPRPRR